MKMFIAGTIAALTLALAAPASAAVLRIGPGGVGIGPGFHGGYYRGRGPVYQGRSVGYNWRAFHHHHI